MHNMNLVINTEDICLLSHPMVREFTWKEEDMRNNFQVISKEVENVREGIRKRKNRRKGMKEKEDKEKDGKRKEAKREKKT